MRACDLMKELIGEDFLDKTAGDTVDNCKAGDPEREITRVATCFTATVDVLRQAKEWGAQLLITHEPTFYDHCDNDDGTELTRLKKAAVEETGMTVYRWHDSPHLRAEDIISANFIDLMGWEGSFDGVAHFELKEEKAIADLVAEISKKANIRHPRVVGRRDGSVRQIGLFLGHRGDDFYKPFRDNGEELAVCGELCEWYNAEPVRDMAQLGMKKTLVLLGHAGSERFCMEYLARNISRLYPQLDVRYFECGELYTYFD